MLCYAMLCCIVICYLICYDSLHHVTLCYAKYHLPLLPRCQYELEPLLRNLQGSTCFLWAWNTSIEGIPGGDERPDQDVYSYPCLLTDVVHTLGIRPSATWWCWGDGTVHILLEFWLKLFWNSSSIKSMMHHTSWKMQYTMIILAIFSGE